MMAGDAVEIECGRCKAKMRLHKPILLRIDNGAMSQVTLVPSWSAEERRCSGCGAVNAPTIAPTVEIGWVAYEPAAKAQPLIVPAGPVPEEVMRKLRAAG